MANKTIPALPIYGSQDSDKRKKDLIEITKNDGTYATPTYGTGASRKMSVEELKTALDITSQTVTDGITDKSPSENAVFDAVYAKGLINGTIWVNAYTALGDFNLSIDKYNNVGYTDAEGPISVILPTHTASMSGKTIIVEPHRFNSGLTNVNISIPGLQVDGGGGAGTYTEVITKMGQIVTIQANYYGWHVIGHTNQVPDISFKLDLDGGNANQDIDIDGFGLNAKHFKVNGTAGAGHIGLKHQSANISASASESSIGADIVGDPVWKNDGGAIDKLELQSKKDSTGGYVGLTLFKINFKNVLNTFTSFFTNSNTASRTYTFQNRDGIIADDTDLALANNQIAYETWSTNANYTTINTTAKRLIILQTGTLTATRTLTLSTPSTPGQEVVIVASGSISSTIKIIVAVGFKINAILNSIDIILPYSQTWITSIGGGGWSTSQASPQFTETTTALTASKYVGTLSGFNLPNNNSFTAPFPTGFVEGSMTYHRGTNALFVRNNVAQTAVFLPYILETGWKDYYVAGNVLKYWDATTNIASTLKPIEWGNNTVWNRQYILEHYPSDGTDAQPFRCIFQVNSTGVPSILQVIQSDGVNQWTISGGQLVLSGLRGFTTVRLRNHSLTNRLPELYQKYSADGQTSYVTGTGGFGVGHASQVSSAILQADSTSKGFLPPRMTNTQRTSTAGGTPPVGLIVYCTDATEGLYIYKSTGWIQII